MNIHEYQSIELFRQAGIPVAGGEVALTAEEARSIAAKVGYPVVLKAQVLTGGRGKAGGVKVVHSDAELIPTFEQIQKLEIKGYKVERILVVHALAIKKEFYCAVTIDNIRGDVVLIASTAGGVDIEQTAKENPQAIQKYYLEGKKEIDPVRWPAFIQSLFPNPSDQANATDILQKLINVFFTYDCSLAEINPLVIDGGGKWYAADAKVNFDDNALYRHADIAALRDMKYEVAEELEAKEAGLSFVKLEGNVGCIVNGAGLAMATMDIIKILGGQPDNFLDVGGSSNPQKVLSALKIILRNKNVKAILINIFGGITRCDDIAKGIIEATKQLDLWVPFVVRLTGTNEEEAKKLLAAEGINTYSTMREAVLKVVALANQ